jgi:membrane fusion protein (multidrug efflux system)
MWKTSEIALAGLLLGGLLLTGCDRQLKADVPPQASPPEVGVMTITPQRVVLTTELSGRTAPHLLAEVRPQVGGIIQKRLFTEGTDVKAGEVLYQIDPASYRAVYKSAKAGLARAEANLNPLKLKEERFRELVKINAVSQQDYDDIVAAFRQAEAEIEGAKAAVEAARIDLDYSTLKAPISGRISRSAVTTGALVKAEQDQSLATIQQLDPIYVDVTQSSTELLALKRNLASGLLKNSDPQQAKVRLVLEDGTSYPQPGTLKFSEVTVDPSTGSVTLRTLFPNPQQLLLPGMFVRVVLEEGVNEQALLVPQRGVTRNPAGKALVMVVGAEEKVESRVIQVARTVDDNWLVSDGLKPGDRVILEGTQRARPGTVVKAVPFGTPAAAPQPAAAK